MGIIPAYAGNTPRGQQGRVVGSGSSPHTRGTPTCPVWCHVRRRDHPRIRGEHRARSAGARTTRGIIPAYAGNTVRDAGHRGAIRGSSPHTRGTLPPRSLCCPLPRDHPRIRGEHRDVMRILPLSVGIIPAYAGNTGAWRSPAEFVLGSSPHTRGTPSWAITSLPITWDHPRIRGEHSPLSIFHGMNTGIIPAYAGNTMRLRSAERAE